MGMAHRGRLNVLANIVGKSYGEIFEEFEGNLDPDSVQGSGDVKYHKGAQRDLRGPQRRLHPGHHGLQPLAPRGGRPGGGGHGPGQAGRPRAASGGAARTSRTGPGIPSRCCPSSCTVTPPSPARAWWPRPSTSPGLAGYRTGGTVHIVINNQLGFTTAPEAARTSVYPTDVAKMVQAPIFHVNGDDPEACARAARLAFGFRQAFHKDVVIDMVCYRRHGHNEGDDPSYTQPLMYALIEAKRSVRKLYTESLVRRGDISLEEAEQALDDFSARLQAALDETRAEAEAEERDGERPRPARVRGARPVDPAGRDRGGRRRCCPGWPTRCARSPRASSSTPSWPASSSSGTRWWPTARSTGPWASPWPSARCCWRATNVRLTGQDTRRGTFSQRHAVLVDHTTGAEHVPLAGLEGGRFTIRDSLLSEYACVGFEYGYSVEAHRRPGGLGGPVRRLLERRRDHRRQLPGGRRGQVGPEVRPGPAPAPRLRGPGPRALVGPHRAVPDPVRPGQHAGHRADHRGPVLPPAAGPGQGDRTASR